MGPILFDNFEIDENIFENSLRKIYRKFLNSQKVRPQERELAFFIFLSGSAQKIDSDKNFNVTFKETHFCGPVSASSEAERAASVPSAADISANRPWPLL